ncbi:hypothetical protein TNCV_2013531 [Trichonephila clavipes]|nr:hypothetical protein TNCV_2013531 [Trichonephila clavipes]
MLGRRIAACQPPPICLLELRRALLDEWCNIPQDQIDNLISSMPRRSNNLVPQDDSPNDHGHYKILNHREVYQYPWLVPQDDSPNVTMDITKSSTIEKKID